MESWHCGRAALDRQTAACRRRGPVFARSDLNRVQKIVSPGLKQGYSVYCDVGFSFFFFFFVMIIIICHDFKLISGRQHAGAATLDISEVAVLLISALIVDIEY